MKKANVLLLMCDQFRGDCLSIAHHPDVKTPYLDSLANDGVLFEQAYSACPSCIPARAALLTGRSQRAHPVSYTHLILRAVWKTGNINASSFSISMCT